jgi:hypothetical protein
VERACLHARICMSACEHLSTCLVCMYLVSGQGGLTRSPFCMWPRGDSHLQA